MATLDATARGEEATNDAGDVLSDVERLGYRLLPLLSLEGCVGLLSQHTEQGQHQVNQIPCKTEFFRIVVHWLSMRMNSRAEFLV